MVDRINGSVCADLGFRSTHEPWMAEMLSFWQHNPYFDFFNFFLFFLYLLSRPSLSTKTKFLIDIQSKTSNGAGNLLTGHHKWWLKSGKIPETYQMLKNGSPHHWEPQSDLIFWKILKNKPRSKFEVLDQRLLFFCLSSLLVFQFLISNSFSLCL